MSGEPVGVSEMVAAGEIDWDADVVADPAEVYQSLVRSLQRTEGFSLFFVRCVPGDQADLVQRLQADLPKLHMQQLELKEELVDGNLYQRVSTLPDLAQLNVLFISGLEKSLDPYVKSGYGGQGDYYKRDTVPRLLGHLNLQRERFRDDFPFCFVFFLSAFGIKYIARRAPDFFDWRSGIFEFVPDAETVRKLTRELRGDFEEYLNWSHQQRIDRIREIQGILEEDQQTPNQQASLWIEKGNILLADQNYEAAIESYDQTLQFRPDYSYYIWCLRGSALSNIGRDEEAIESYNQAIAIKPDLCEAWFARGIALSALGRSEEAIESYDKALAVKPDYYDTWYTRGRSLSALGRTEEAIESYGQALQVKPNYYDAWYNRGLALDALERYEEAIASYDQGLAAKLDDQDAWNNRGIALSALGRKEEAIESHNQAIAVKPDYHSAWNSRGIALSALGRYEEAIESYDKVLKFSPNEPHIFYRKALCLCYVSLGKVRLVLKNLRQALNLNLSSIIKKLPRF
jgi:tetratricopeptide (TPR) repeat protein